MRNSDIIFFVTMISMLLLVFVIAITGVSIPYIRFWWILIGIVIIPKLMYILGNRYAWVVKMTNWLESTNNPVDRYIKRKLRK